MLNKITYNFNSKNISTDAGAVTLHKFTHQIGLEDSLKNAFDEKKESTRGRQIQFSKGSVINELIHGYMKGYKNPTQIAETKGDVTIEAIKGSFTPSQSTFSRLNFSTEDENKIHDFNKNLIQKYFETLLQKNNGKKLECLEVSNDSTKIETFGKQEDAEYISHYGVVGYHPDLVTEDKMKLIMKGVLRKGQVYSSNGSELLIKKVIELLAPYTEKIIFRADSAYAKPEILDVLHSFEEVKIEYFIKAKTYMKWIRDCDLQIKFQSNLYHPLDLPEEYFQKISENGTVLKEKKFFEFNYQVKTWKKPERIISQVEHNGANCIFESDTKHVNFLITNSNCDPQEAFKSYGKRGNQEKIIEEFKNDMYAKHLSHDKKLKNSCEFLVKVIAFNLMQMLRLETLYGTQYENCRISTLRKILVKIGGQLIKHARKIVLKLSKSFAFKHWFTLVMQRIPKIKLRLS